MEAIRSSETSVDARSTQRHTPEDDILHSHRCESLKSYMRVFLEDVMFQLVKKFPVFFVTINAFGESSVVKKWDFVFRHPNTKHKAQTKEGRSDKRRQTNIKYVIFYNLLRFLVFFIPGRT
jgi:hypothetical protein